jgi:hypothetical protein
MLSFCLTHRASPHMLTVPALACQHTHLSAFQITGVVAARASILCGAGAGCRPTKQQPWQSLACTTTPRGAASRSSPPPGAANRSPTHGAASPRRRSSPSSPWSGTARPRLVGPAARTAQQDSISTSTSMRRRRSRTTRQPTPALTRSRRCWRVRHGVCACARACARLPCTQLDLSRMCQALQLLSHMHG